MVVEVQQAEKRGTRRFALRLPVSVNFATNTGAPLATAGGLVFIGGTSDGQFRAFDAMTGKELWSSSPGFNVAGYAISYKGANGKQYIVISGPRMVAYALP